MKYPYYKIFIFIGENGNLSVIICFDNKEQKLYNMGSNKMNTVDRRRYRLPIAIALTGMGISGSVAAYQVAADTSWQARFGIVCPQSETLLPNFVKKKDYFPVSGIVYKSTRDSVDCTNTPLGNDATITKYPIKIVSLPTNGNLHLTPDESVVSITGNGQFVTKEIDGSAIVFHGVGLRVKSIEISVNKSSKNPELAPFLPNPGVL